VCVLQNSQTTLQMINFKKHLIYTKNTHNKIFAVLKQCWKNGPNMFYRYNFNLSDCVSLLTHTMSLAPKINEIRCCVLDWKPDVACFTETWLHDSINDNHTYIPEYNFISKNRTSRIPLNLDHWRTFCYRSFMGVAWAKEASPWGPMCNYWNNISPSKRRR
jgi:hypothetical protein